MARTARKPMIFLGGKARSVGWVRASKPTEGVTSAIATKLKPEAARAIATKAQRTVERISPSAGVRIAARSGPRKIAERKKETGVWAPRQTGTVRIM
mgnify:CR=1 FL=1